MRFNQHSDLGEKHALLSPSSPHWLRYDEQKLEARYYSAMSSSRGTALHKLAHEAIRLGVLLHTDNEALATYVEHALLYHMYCETCVYYSDNCFGHADTMCFYDDLLRVHDLKNGVNATSFEQLEVYDALFCLEYSVDPYSIGHELRIYQRDEIKVDNPTPEAIEMIMDKIVESDRLIEGLKEANRW